MEMLSLWVSLVLGLISILTVFTFHQAAGAPRIFAAIILSWVAVHGCLAWLPAYQEGAGAWVKILVVVVPPAVLAAWLFLARSGKARLDGMDLHLLTVIHIVRVPAQVVLYCLFLFKAVPIQAMPGEWSLNILCGLTAPFVYYWGVMKGEVRWRLLLIWNVAGLVSLLAGTVKTVVMIPGIMQQVATPAPEAAAFEFPFLFLPGVIVPVLVCSHLAVIRKLVKAHSYALKNWPAIFPFHL